MRACIYKPPDFLRDYPPVRIAVLDTGVDSKHPFIKGAMKYRIKERRNFVKGDDSNEDDYGHGTHVAALLLRVAPDAQIFVAKVAKDVNILSDHNIAEVSIFNLHNFLTYKMSLFTSYQGYHMGCKSGC